MDEWLAANGVNKVQDMHGVQATSSPGQAYLTNIDGYFDGLAKKYLIKGWWKWNSTPDATAGALDGVSLAMAKADGSWSPVTGYTFASNPAGIAVYSQNGTYYPNAGNASKIDKSGIVYTFKDGWSGTQYIGYQGQVWAWLDSRPKELPIYIKMDYEHTWTDANLSSFGFSWTYPNPPSINMTWNTVPANWIIANQITLYTWRTVN
ncbi:hypothetical protein CTH_2333 [Carboxydocella thermautotrophica]|nr:hypothetical protein CTH_2333 [Carboxydocella thermautotrophica]